MKKYLTIWLTASSTICSSLWLTLFIITLFSTSAHAITLEALQQQVSQYSVIRADFTQNRYIQGLAKPLSATGKMIITKEFGLWWQQQTPFMMTLKMNNQRMEQSIAAQTPQIITAESQPQLFQFNSLLTAIFNADSIALEKNFILTLSEQEEQWHLSLVPKTTPLDKIFSQITLTGKRYLSQITIDDKQNDKTIILFSHHQTTPLTKHEQQLFK